MSVSGKPRPVKEIAREIAKWRLGDKVSEGRFLLIYELRASLAKREWVKKKVIITVIMMILGFCVGFVLNAIIPF